MYGLLKVSIFSVPGCILLCILAEIVVKHFEQKDPKTGELEGLSFNLNLCEAVATWEQVSIICST